MIVLRPAAIVKVVARAAVPGNCVLARSGPVHQAQVSVDDEAQQRALRNIFSSQVRCRRS